MHNFQSILEAQVRAVLSIFFLLPKSLPTLAVLRLDEYLSQVSTLIHIALKFAHAGRVQSDASQHLFCTVKRPPQRHPRGVPVLVHYDLLLL
jgi:hypothetical protein